MEQGLMRIQRILNHCLLSSLTDEEIFHDILNNIAIYHFYYHSWTIVHLFCFVFGIIRMDVDGCINYSILGSLHMSLCPWIKYFYLICNVFFGCSEGCGTLQNSLEHHTDRKRK